jgi:ABC-type uncharacterized transport system fused permease/ATPase subunit
VVVPISSCDAFGACFSRQIIEVMCLLPLPRVPRLTRVQAFGVAKFGRAHRVIQRNLDLSHRKDRAPLVDRTAEAPPPIVVVVMGPPGSGKSTLIKVRGQVGAWRAAAHVCDSGGKPQFPTQNLRALLNSAGRKA